jgi:hypothetical protein
MLVAPLPQSLDHAISGLLSSADILVQLKKRLLHLRQIMKVNVERSLRPLVFVSLDESLQRLADFTGVLPLIKDPEAHRFDTIRFPEL